MTYSVSNWYHSRPKEYFPKCIKMFGKPTFVANVKHGYAFWKTKGLFSQHVLIDEDVKHCVPRPHHDYFYSSVKFFVPEDKICSVLKISGSLNYDGLKKELTARCGGIGANYATIYLGMLVATGKLSITEVKSKDMYPRMISGDILTYKDMKKKMMEEKKKNKRKYARELKLDFATYAYDRCYTKKKKTNKLKKTLKKKGGSKKTKLINTKGQICDLLKQNCCPHMSPNEDGQYRSTNEVNDLKYKDNIFKLKTCCQMCFEAMQKLIKNNVSKFDKDYSAKIVKENNNTYLKLSNVNTGKPIQLLPLKK